MKEENNYQEMAAARDVGDNAKETLWLCFLFYACGEMKWHVSSIQNIFAYRKMLNTTKFIKKQMMIINNDNNSKFVFHL